MRFVPKGSVRAQLTLTILLVIALSWLLSTVMANYLHLQELHALRQMMLEHPDRYPEPIREPRFTLRELVFGPPPRPNARHFFDPRRPPRPALDDPGMRPPEPPPTDPNPSAPPRLPLRMENLQASMMVARAVIALCLALLAGAWLSRRFTRPLAELTQGAQVLQSGKLDYRLPVRGRDEFTQVASAMNGLAERVSTQISHLEEEARRRQHFLADVAHELRSPVTTMRTMAGALESGLADDRERRDRAVQSLVRTSDRLLHLVTDLLELARLDLHELPLHCQPVDLRELAGACLETHADAAAAAQITLEPMAPGEPVMIDADPDRLAQVLDNLLENAIHYAGTGAHVRITLTPGTPLRLTVADTGRGIPAHHLPYLFDPFYRADAARTPGTTHSGLGLRIARGLIEAHGGTLELASEEGRGTQVVITLGDCPHGRL